MGSEPSLRRSLPAALVLALAAALLGAGSAQPAGNICLNAGLASAAVRRAEGILAEIPQEQGIPVCELLTKRGKVYVTLYPRREESAVHTSWEIDIHATSVPQSGLGRGASFLYAAGYKEEAVGFLEGVHFIWLTSAAQRIRSELVALAGVIYAKLA